MEMILLSLLNQFYEYVSAQGISKENIDEQKGDGFTLVSFGEEGEKGVIYNVAIVFYKDDSVEVYIRKNISDYDEVKVLKSINSLNAEYKGATFYVENSILNLKSYIKTEGKIDVVLAEMVRNMRIAQSEFIKF